MRMNSVNGLLLALMSLHISSVHLRPTTQTELSDRHRLTRMRREVTLSICRMATSDGTEPVDIPARWVSPCRGAIAAAAEADRGSRRQRNTIRDADLNSDRARSKTDNETSIDLTELLKEVRLVRRRLGKLRKEVVQFKTCYVSR